MLTAHISHQLFMQFTDEPHADGKTLKPRNSVFQGNHVIADFTQVFRAAFHNRSRFRSKQFAKRGLCALNLARQHRFALYKGPDQHMGIWQMPSFASQPADEAVCV